MLSSNGTFSKDFCKGGRNPSLLNYFIKSIAASFLLLPAPESRALLCESVRWGSAALSVALQKQAFGRMVSSVLDHVFGGVCILRPVR